MQAAGEAGQTRWIAARIGVVAALLAAGFALITARAIKLQVVDRAQLTRHGNDQWRRNVELRPRRGAITDRNGETLAASADAPSIAANPALLGRLPRRELAAVARALSLDLATVERKAQRPAKFVWLKRRVSPAEAAAVQALELDGVGVFQEARRYYTSKNLAAQLLGFVGDDGDGQEGIERAYDEALQGGGARLASLRDARGRSVLDEAPQPEALRAGSRVELTIDVGLQLAAEQALGRAVTQARAAAGMVVAMDPRSGEILAIANAPSFNPNVPRSRGSLRNRAVLDTYEPGSTFKIFTISGALDTGAIRADETFDCENGAYRIGRHVIHDHKGLGRAPPARIIATSSNIGAAKIGARLGRERLQSTLRAFGFGERSGTDIAGEPRGAVPYPKAEVALATMSFGQGVAATPLQITTAIAAIANGGMLMKPLLVRKVVDGASGAILSQNDPTPVRRVVSRQTAAVMTTWLEGVVHDPDGTGKRARLDGWRAAGKTGTAQKADPVTKRYSADKRFSSFVGFAPADAPRIAIGVFIDEPRGEVYGGEIAAPVFREVAEHALKSLGVPPSQPPSSGAKTPITLARSESATGPAETARSEPALGADLPIFEEATDRPEDHARVAVPVLTGLPARSALRALEQVNLLGEVRGTGRVVSQAPRAGQVVDRGARVRIVLAPPRS